VLAIAPYTSPVHHAERYVAAAFTLLSGVERLIIDLREGRGGTPETIALICGYLLGDEPVHLQDIVDRLDDAHQYWTSPAAGRLEESVRICVLTSERTFSGCEELAYNLQAQQRATIVGRRTGGGAHPVAIFELTDQLEATVPIARSINALAATSVRTGRSCPSSPRCSRTSRSSAGPAPSTRTACEVFRQALEATGHKKVIIAGVSTTTCPQFPALDRVADGYDVHGVIDASGSERAHRLRGRDCHPLHPGRRDPHLVLGRSGARLRLASGRGRRLALSRAARYAGTRSPGATCSTRRWTTPTAG
jgi:hypothetical protein